MITDDAISRILEKTEAEMTGIDQVALRRILGTVLNGYTLSIKEGCDEESDLTDKIRIYLNSLRLDGLSEKTIKNYGYKLRRFAGQVQKPVIRITTQDLRGYLAWVVETYKIKNTTLETEKSILRSFFGWLELEEFITKDPTKKIKATRVEKRIRRSLTVEELEQMRDACSTPRERCIFEMFFCTGVRLDELSKVDVTDLNWTDNSIRVIGKGNKERVVYFSDKSKLYIRKYLAVRGESESNALFIATKKPKARLGHRSLYNEIKAIAARAGFDKSVYPHLLRHSFATIGLKSGMSINVIHDLLGHQSLDTTLIYARLDQETARHEYRKHLNQ